MVTHAAANPTCEAIAGDRGTIRSLLASISRSRPVFLAASHHRGVGAIRRRLAGLLSRASGLTFVKLTPAHLRALRHWIPIHPGAARLLVIGGEALATDDLHGLASAPDTLIVNEYVPTEATVGCCTYEARAGDLVQRADGAVPIGRAIRGTTLRLLSPGGTAVLPGAPAGIAIGGDGVARGYAGRPDLTAAVFIPDDSGDVPGARVYLTGDLARVLPSDDLVFLGRADTRSSATDSGSSYKSRTPRDRGSTKASR